MKTKLTILAIFLLIVGYMAAQSSVQIKDILVSPVMVVDTITNLPVETEGETLAVMCKINNLSSVETIQILVGTSENAGDISVIEGIISEDSGIYYLTQDGETTMLNGNVISVIVELNQIEVDSYNYISVYAIDGENQESNHLVFTK